MKKLIYTFGLLAAIGASQLNNSANAQVVASGNCGASGNNLTYQVTGTAPNYTLTISGTGAMATFSAFTTAPWYTHRANIATISIGSNVTTIGNYAFEACSRFTSVTIPNRVKSIGDAAFSGCTALTSVSIGDSVTSIGYSAFFNCGNLTSVAIPNSVTTIDVGAFYECFKLSSLSIGSGVTSIGMQAFYRCTTLTSITCNAITPPTTASDAFQLVPTSTPVFIPCGSNYNVTGWITFTNRLNCIAGGITTNGLVWAFACDSTLTISGSGAMNNYTGGGSTPWSAHRSTIKKIAIYSGVTSIGNYNFDGCSNSTSVTIPNTVTSIGNVAFIRYAIIRY